MLFDVNHILQAGGLLAIAFIVFAESGLLFGFFLPGDSLLLAAGYLASQNKLSLSGVLAVVIVSTIIGYQFGYRIGEKLGPKVFNRKDGLFFRQEYIVRTNDFLKKHGGKSVVLARFVPYVRTFVSVIAGVGSMNKRLFAIYNVIGAVLLGGGVTLIAYWLGNKIPNFDRVILVVVIGSLLVLHLVISWRVVTNGDARRKLKSGLREEWNHFFGRKKGN